MASSKVQKTLNVVAVLRVLIEAVASIVDMFKKKKDDEPETNGGEPAPNGGAAGTNGGAAEANPQDGAGENADTQPGATAALG